MTVGLVLSPGLPEGAHTPAPAIWGVALERDAGRLWVQGEDWIGALEVTADG